MNTFVFIVLNALAIIVPFIFSTRSSELFEFPKLLVIYMGAALLLPLVGYRIYETVKNRSRTTDHGSKDQGIIARKNGARGIEQRGLTKQSTFMFGAIVLFFLSQVLSTYFSIDQHVSVFGYYSRFNGGLMSLLAYMILFAAAYFFLTKEQVKKFLLITFLGGIIVALWGLPSHFGHDFICLLAQGSFSVSCWTADFNPPSRMFSTLGQPNWFATYVLILTFIALYLLVIGYKILNKKSDQINRNILLILFALFSIENLWTNSKSGMIMYIVLVPLFFLGAALSKKVFSNKTARHAGMLGVGVYICIAGLFFLPQITTSIQRVLPQKAVVQPIQTAPVTVEPVNITPSSQIRKAVWKGAWDLVLQYPLFGTGVETFAYAYNFTRPVEHNTFSEWEFVYNKAHNELLNYAATSGLVGLATYLAMFAAFVLPAVWKFLKERDLFSLFYICTMFAIFGMNFVGFSTTMTNVVFYILPALWLVQHKDTGSQESVDGRLQTPVSSRQSTDKSFLPSTPFILYVLFAVCSLFYFINYFVADYFYARGKELKQVEDIAGAYEYTQKAIDIRREPIYLDQQAYLTANLASSLKMQKDSSNATKFAQQAMELNKETLEGSPQNVFYLKTAAKVYYLLGVTYMDDKDRATGYMNRALQALESAMRLAPTDPKIPYTIAAILADGKPEEAKKLLERTISLKSDYTPAHELLKKITAQ